MKNKEIDVKALAELLKDEKQREIMRKAWAREIRKEERRNPKSAGIDFMKAVRF